MTGMLIDLSLTQQDARNGNGQFWVAFLISPAAPPPFPLFLPAFSLCPVIIAANQFNLGSEADVLMRMERCWMIPPGHYWWLGITHTANRGTDRQLGCTHWHLQMLPLCVCLWVYTVHWLMCLHAYLICAWRAQLPLHLLTSLCHTGLYNSVDFLK